MPVKKMLVIFVLRCLVPVKNPSFQARRLIESAFAVLLPPQPVERPPDASASLVVEVVAVEVLAVAVELVALVEVLGTQQVLVVIQNRKFPI